MAFPSLIYQLLNVNKMLRAMEPSAGNGSPRGVFGPSVLLSSPDNSARKKKSMFLRWGGYLVPPLVHCSKGGPWQWNLIAGGDRVALQRSGRVRGKDVGWPQPTCHESKYFTSQRTALPPQQAFAPTIFWAFTFITLSAFFFQWVHFALTYRCPFY